MLLSDVFDVELWVKSLELSLMGYSNLFVEPDIDLSLVKFVSMSGEADVIFQKHMFEYFGTKRALMDLLTALIKVGAYKWAYQKMLECGLKTTKDLILSKEDIASIVNSVRNEVLMTTIFDEK